MGNRGYCQDHYPGHHPTDLLTSAKETIKEVQEADRKLNADRGGWILGAVVKAIIKGVTE